MDNSYWVFNVNFAVFLDAHISACRRRSGMPAPPPGGGQPGASNAGTGRLVRGCVRELWCRNCVPICALNRKKKVVTTTMY